MAVAFVRSLTAGTAKVAGTTVTFGIPATVPAGNLIVVWVGFDNLTLTTPVVSGITKAAGETANWVQIASHNSNTATAGGGVRGEMWAMLTTTAWPAATHTVTLSAAVTAKVAVGAEYSGVGITLRGTAGSGSDGSGTPTATTAGTPPATGDLILGGGTFGTAGITPGAGDSDTVNGAWSTGLVASTAGSTSGTNVSGIHQHKIVTAGGHQTYNPTLFAGSGSAVVALIPESVATGRPKVWTGLAWTAKQGKAWTGSAWVEKPWKRWTGTGWKAV